MASQRHPFQYQRPTEAGVRAIEDIRKACTFAYDTILESAPQSAERTLAIRKLEEASMWANKAIVFAGERYLS